MDHETNVAAEKAPKATTEPVAEMADAAAPARRRRRRGGRGRGGKTTPAGTADSGARATPPREVGADDEAPTGADAASQREEALPDEDAHETPAKRSSGRRRGSRAGSRT